MIRIYTFVLTAFLYTTLLFSQSVPHTEKWNLDNLDVARNVDYLTDNEKDVVLVMNMARTNPRLYAELYLEPMMALFDGKLIKYPGETFIMTNEGIKALKECIRVLKKQKPVGILIPKIGLSKAAADHAADIGKKGKLSHTGSDRSDIPKRVNRYGNWDIELGENIDAGNLDPVRIVSSLLIDDGVKNRGHRINIFNANFNFIGVSINTHKKYRHCCVMDYAGDYQDN